MSLSIDIQLTPEIIVADHLYNKDHKPVTIVEFGDYECEHCRDFVGVADELLQKHSSILNLVYRHFPLKTQHPMAFLAAEAAEAAGSQDKFWQMHRLLFENQRNFAHGYFEELAAQLSLNMSEFEADLSGHVYMGKVNEDFYSGVRSGVNGTPTIFINGFRYLGKLEVSEISKAIELELKKFAT